MAYVSIGCVFDVNQNAVPYSTQGFDISLVLPCRDLAWVALERGCNFTRYSAFPSRDSPLTSGCVVFQLDFAQHYVGAGRFRPLADGTENLREPL